MLQDHHQNDPSSTGFQIQNHFEQAVSALKQSRKALNKFCLKVYSWYEYETGKTAFDSLKPKAEIIAEHFLDGLGYSVHHTSDLPFNCHGKTSFVEKKVEILDSIHEKSVSTALSHELLHVLKHRNFAIQFGKPNWEFPDTLEQDAKIFARFFTLPELQFQTAFNYHCDEWFFGYPASLDDKLFRQFGEWVIPQLSDTFHVATKSVGIRIKELKLLDPMRVEKFFLTGNPQFKF